MNAHKLVADAVTLESESGRTPPLTVSHIRPGNGNNCNMSLTRTNGMMVVPDRRIRYYNTQQSFINFRGNGLQIGDTFHINNQPSNERRSNLPRTTSIDAMMRSNEPISEQVMDIISDHLGEHWRFLFRKLGYSTGRIDQVAEDYYRNNKEQIYRLLLDYSRNNDDASLGHLIKIMWKNGFKECVVILKEPWKNGEFAVTTCDDSGDKSDKINCKSNLVN